MKTILFDMDGVLINVSHSYRQAIQHTAHYFLKEEISPILIQNYKNRGGFNNDWYLTHQLIKDRGINVDQEEVITIFQEFYCGTDFNGLITKDELLIEPAILAAQCNSFKTGIVTGRPRKEAIFTLTRFNMQSLFQVIITMDDLLLEKGKPDPCGLILAQQALNTTSGWYLGDTPDDMIAAQQAGLVPIGICGTDIYSLDRATLLSQAGASHIFANANSFLSTINKINTSDPFNKTLIKNQKKQEQFP